MGVAVPFIGSPCVDGKSVDTVAELLAEKSVKCVDGRAQTPGRSRILLWTSKMRKCVSESLGTLCW